MRAFMSIQKAADVLGVQYKTIYRLVRAGELPAAKIRRVYRIKAEDLLAYFEAQKTMLHGQVSAPTNDPDPTSPVHST